ncbi:putative tubulin polyglutamylase ttll2 [Phlyctochytrium planicorne]|nr:putative tubulin polyglutamylase ttll2 [Phlyctochytrium planicorne]
MLNAEAKCVERGGRFQSIDEGDEEAKLVYRMAETGPELLKEILEGQGWIPFIEGESKYWNLWWKGSRYRKSDYENCKSWQRLNHFPKTAAITRKDSLFRTLKTMKAIYGRSYDFFPQTFSLPNEYVKFVRVYASEEEKGSKPVWICKPADLSRGRKIFVFKNLEDLTYDCNAILQRYIPNPLLISGYKFDIRCYILVRSYNPLCIYLYDDGLTRFATSLYDTSTLDNLFSHLTNTSINKFSPTLNEPKSGVGLGCKWDLHHLRVYCQSNNIPFTKIWERMISIIILTILPVAMEIQQNPNGCFELYGFDILIDEAFKPWLLGRYRMRFLSFRDHADYANLEVNLSPALSVDNEIDVDVKKVICTCNNILMKKPLLQDVLKLIGLNGSHAKMAQNYIDQMEQFRADPRQKKKGWSLKIDVLAD